MFGSLLVSPHPASPELLEDVDELLAAEPPVPLLVVELIVLVEEVLVEEVLAAAPPVPPLVVEVVDEELVAGAPPVPLLVVELVEATPAPPPPVGLDWTVLPQDEDAAASARSEEPTTRAEPAIFERVRFMGAGPRCRHSRRAGPGFVFRAALVRPPNCAPARTSNERAKGPGAAREARFATA